MQPIRAAALSPTFRPGDKAYNLERAWAGLQAARAEGADLAVFSEWYLTNCVDERAYLVAEPVPEGPCVQEVSHMARKLGLVIAMGIEELDPERGVVYNTHFLAGPEGYLGKHRKTHLMVGEWRWHRPGDRLEVFDIGKARVGIGICHENMYPETSRVQALRGMEVLLAPFGCGGGAELVPPEVWTCDFHMSCWRARCFDNGIFMVVAGGNGHPDKKYRTYACIIDPWAEVVAAIAPEPDAAGLNMVVADLDPERFVSRRTDADYPLKKRRPELYGAVVEAY